MRPSSSGETFKLSPRKSVPPTAIAGAAAAPASDSLSPREKLLACLRASPELPTLPAIALQIIERASDPDCETSELADLISRDAVLCARVLRTVNSAVFGLRHSVASVPQAIRFLGIHPLRSLVLAFALSNLRWSPLPRKALQAHWRVSLAGALAARQLAITARRPAPDNDLVAGLVRDIGVLVLHQLFPTEYQSILDISPEILSAFQCGLEEGVLPMNHAEVGAELLGIWHMPEEITEPVRCHHDWERASRLKGDLRERAQLLYLASQIGQMHLTSKRPMLIREVRRLAHDLFRIDDRALHGFLESLQAQMADFASILDVDIGDNSDLSRLINKGVEEFARLAVTGSGTYPRVVVTSPSGQGAGAKPKPQVIEQPPEEERPTQLASDGSGSEAGAGGHDELLNRLFPRRQTGKLGLIDGYEVTNMLGRGAMGAVFRAMDTKLERPVAIKMLLPHSANDSLARQRFVQEGKAIAAFSHENIVRVFAVGEVSNIPYIVMEYVAGSSLSDWFQEAAPLSYADILRVGLDTASGLAAAHARGLVHRDIKPANLLREQGTGSIKIVDFGLAQVTGKPHLSQSGGLVGTPYFMSPEQADGLRVDARSDMFSLGSVLYVACTGRLPFEGDSLLRILRAVCEGNPPPIRAANPSLPAWLEEIVGGLLAKDPNRRFPTSPDLKKLFLLQWAKLMAESK